MKNLSSLKRERFTLIELLIVISIIAILAGMLLPSLHTARKTAMSIKCLNNIKGIGIGFALYGDTFDYYPPSLMGSVNYPWQALVGGTIWNKDYNLTTLYRELNTIY